MNTSDANRIVDTEFGDVRVENGFGYIMSADNSGELCIKLPDGATDDDVRRIFKDLSYIFS